MKKYFSVFIPLVFSTGLAIFFAFSEPNPDAVFGERAIYDWLSDLWFLIGIITSALTLVILVIYDAFSFWDRASERRKLRRF